MTRTSLLPVSAMAMIPLALTATPHGASNSAPSGLTSSPRFPAVPFPAIVLMTPLTTSRITLLPVSAMKTSPLASTATPSG